MATRRSFIMLSIRRSITRRTGRNFWRSWKLKRRSPRLLDCVKPGADPAQLPGGLRASELFRENFGDSLPRNATRDEMPFDAELRPFGLDILVSGFPRPVFAL